jgi:peptidyl-prolyl cis-trans isomerase A (cyclophilin A)
MSAALFLALALQAASPASPSPARSPAGPVVVMETSEGTIRIALDPVKAPISVKNFLQYVRSGFYNGTIFHRVIPTFMIQGGGFTPDMKEKTELKPPIRNEASNGLRNVRGTVAMARTDDPNSATAQFFINVKNNAILDYGIAPGAGYAVFGQLIEGLDVVDKIKNVPTTRVSIYDDVPLTPVLIKSARVEGEAAAKPAGVTKPAAKPSTAPHPKPSAAAKP